MEAKKYVYDNIKSLNNMVSLYENRLKIFRNDESNMDCFQEAIYLKEDIEDMLNRNVLLKFISQNSFNRK